MKETKLCIDLIQNVEMSLEDQIPLMKKCEFDGIFTCFWPEERMKRIAKLAKDYELDFPFVHAPFSGVDDMWRENADIDQSFQLLWRSVESTADIEVPVLVMHVFRGYEYTDVPNEVGIERFYKLVKRARELGVSVALENLEGEEFLDCLMTAFKDEKNVGFCWDSGHEFCYNGGKDMLKKYGDKLLCTHINDNVGCTFPNGQIGKRDDLHLFPFDGAINWENAMERLRKTPFDGPLTFELKKQSYPDLPIEQFIKTAQERAEKIKALYEKSNQLF